MSNFQFPHFEGSVSSDFCSPPFRWLLFSLPPQKNKNRKAGDAHVAEDDYTLLRQTRIKPTPPCWRYTSENFYANVSLRPYISAGV